MARLIIIGSVVLVCVALLLATRGKGRKTEEAQKEEGPVAQSSVRPPRKRDEKGRFIKG